MSQKWDERFLRLAAHVAAWSKDPSTKCGAVVARGNDVLGMGYNGFPAATPDDPALLENRPEKYARVIHAEVNAVVNAYRKGLNVEGATLYTWPPGIAPSCDRCTAFVIHAGIKRVVYYREETEMSKRWEPDRSLKMYAEAGVEVVPILTADPWAWIADKIAKDYYHGT